MRKRKWLCLENGRLFEQPALKVGVLGESRVRIDPLCVGFHHCRERLKLLPGLAVEQYGLEVPEEANMRGRYELLHLLRGITCCFAVIRQEAVGIFDEWMRERIGVRKSPEVQFL